MIGENFFTTKIFCTLRYIFMKALLELLWSELLIIYNQTLELHLCLQFHCPLRLLPPRNVRTCCRKAEQFHRCPLSLLDKIQPQIRRMKNPSYIYFTLGHNRMKKNEVRPNKLDIQFLVPTRTPLQPAACLVRMHNSTTLQSPFECVYRLWLCETTSPQTKLRNCHLLEILSAASWDYITNWTM